MPCEILTLDIGDLDRPGKRARVISKGADDVRPGCAETE